MTQPGDLPQLLHGADHLPVERVTWRTHANERAGGQLFWVGPRSASAVSPASTSTWTWSRRRRPAQGPGAGTIWSSTLAQIRKELGEEFREASTWSGTSSVPTCPFMPSMGFHSTPAHRPRRLVGGDGTAAKGDLGCIAKGGGHRTERKVVPFPVPQRIVLIGSAGTAGHTDFLTHLEKNAWGMPSMWPASIHRCKGRMPCLRLWRACTVRAVAMRTPVDAVVPWGGYAKLDLDIFNDLTLCRTTASMEVPVLTAMATRPTRPWPMRWPTRPRRPRRPWPISSWSGWPNSRVKWAGGLRGSGRMPRPTVRARRGLAPFRSPVERTSPGLRPAAGRLACRRKPRCAAPGRPWPSSMRTWPGTGLGCGWGRSVARAQCGLAGRIGSRHTARGQAPLEAARGTDSPDEGYAGLAGTGPHIEAGLLDHPCRREGFAARGRVGAWTIGGDRIGIRYIHCTCGGHPSAR